MRQEEVSLEPRQSSAVVRRGFRETKATSKRKAGVQTSPSGEIGRDEPSEKCKSPKWFPRKSLSGQRARSRSCIPPASRSKCQKPKETMPGNTGRTDSRSPANDLAQATNTDYSHSVRANTLNDEGWRFCALTVDRKTINIAA